ncbi:MAG: D-amino-acid transaminase [Pseudomonadota bacterium]
MSRIAFVNGRYVLHREAAAHIEDRGYQFADGVYEVIALANGRFVDEGPHLDRLAHNLRELRIAPAMSRRSLAQITREVVRRNGVVDGILYMQMTRGVAPREHSFPALSRTSVVMTARRDRRQAASLVEDGVTVLSVPDLRWGRCDIKSVALLPNVLAKQAAREAGAFEAWFVRPDGTVTEGASNNAWIVTRDGELVTHPLGPAILGGITRMRVIELARAHGLGVVERPFSLDEAKAAREAFLTGTTARVLAVTRIDDHAIGNGRAGSLARRLRDLYLDYMAGPRAPTAGAGGAP